MKLVKRYVIAFLIIVVVLCVLDHIEASKFRQKAAYSQEIENKEEVKKNGKSMLD